MILDDLLNFSLCNCYRSRKGFNFLGRKTSTSKLNETLKEEVNLIKYAVITEVVVESILITWGLSAYYTPTAFHIAVLKLRVLQCKHYILGEIVTRQKIEVV